MNEFGALLFDACEVESAREMVNHWVVLFVVVGCSDL
jgi:hypothetical protein